MRIAILIAVLFLFIMSFGRSTANPLQMEAEDGFFRAIEDLPIMRGLHEVTEAVATFDILAGRIAEIYAESEGVSRLQVSRFYEQTLPQLCWVRSSHNQYRREGGNCASNSSVGNP